MTMQGIGPAPSRPRPRVLAALRLLVAAEAEGKLETYRDLEGFYAIDAPDDTGRVARVQIDPEFLEAFKKRGIDCFELVTKERDLRTLEN